MILTGQAIITDDTNLVFQSLMNPATKVINLDPDTKFDNPNVIGGGSLMPPPEAMMAMVDGDEQRFDLVYNYHYETQDLQEYITIIIAFLYQGGNLVFYHPDLHATDNTLVTKFLNIIFDKFGIGIGIPNEVPFQFNDGFTILWLNLLYSALIIDPRTFLLNYPMRMQIEINIMDMLIKDMKLLEVTRGEQERHIYDLVRKLKEKPDLKIPIYSTI